MLDDGVYGLRFECREKGEAGGPPLSGEGLAVLRGGRIVGSDPHGGVFRGRCRYDATRGEAVVEVQLAIPPNGELLTGLAAGPGGALLEVSGRFPPSRPASSTVIEIGGATVAVELRFLGPLV